jgi:hypothetical protein
MKSFLLTAIMAAVAVFAFAGCADQATKGSASAGNPSDRTYNRDDLQKTGRQTTSEAIQRSDPSVTVSSGGRR